MGSCSIPTRPYQHLLPPTITCRFSRGPEGPLTLGYVRGQYQSNDLAVRFSQGRRNRMRVDIHGRSNICVPQEFLLHVEIHTERVKQR